MEFIGGVPKGWVAEFQDILAEYQIPLGHALVDAGADLIIGHHPHTLHGIERYGPGWIIYSAGNFLFHQIAVGTGLRLSRPYPPYRLETLTGREVRESAVFRITLSADGVKGIQLVSVLLDAAGEPETLTGEEAHILLGRVNGYCAPLGSRILTVGDRGQIGIVESDSSG